MQCEPSIFPDEEVEPLLQQHVLGLPNHLGKICSINNSFKLIKLRIDSSLSMVSNPFENANDPDGKLESESCNSLNNDN